MRLGTTLLGLAANGLLVWTLLGNAQERQEESRDVQTLSYQQLRDLNEKLAVDFAETKRVLRIHSWTEDEEVISEVAALLVKEAHGVGVDISLVVSVALIENPWLDNSAVSFAGAVGQMQIMPRYWANSFAECGPHTTLPGNVCIGVRVLKHYLDTTSTERQALLRYNGCVRTPNCEKYADYVYSFRNSFNDQA